MATAGSDSEMRRKLNAQKEIWNLEQVVISSLVQVEPDPPIDTSVVHDNPLFHVAKDDHNDVYSFSGKTELYGGVDVSFPENEGDDAVAVYVVIDRRTMECVYRDYAFFALEIPYIPTYLAFREIKPLQELVCRQIDAFPDFTPRVILVDGNGILHPRQAGIACFLGTRTNIPTIGIGKTLLCEGGWTRERLSSAIDTFLKKVHDSIEQNPETLPEKLSHCNGTIIKRICPDPTTYSSNNGSTTDTVMSSDTSPFSSSEFMSTTTTGKVSMNRQELLEFLAPYCNAIAIPLEGGEDPRFPVLGCAMVGHGGGGGGCEPSTNTSKKSDQSKSSCGTVKPIFISVGHKISLYEATKVVAWLSMYRIPEPVRQADLFGRELIRQQQQQQQQKKTMDIDDECDQDT